MSGHTPGPWFVSERALCRVYAGTDDTVATTMQQSSLRDQWEANARLIAAAPELLALLQELIDIEGPQPGTHEWARKVHAAIAKATGAQS